MAFTYDVTTDIGRVRRTIPDKDEDDAFWTDEDIESFIIDEGDWRRATAACLEAMAVDSAFVLQVLQIQDLHTNGAEVAQALFNRAKLLREQAVAFDGNEDSEFEVIEMVVDNFSYRERYRKQLLREA